MSKSLILLMISVTIPALAVRMLSAKQNAHPEAQPSQSEIKGLLADGPAPGMAEKLNLFGQFVGDWKTTFEQLSMNGTWEHGDGQIHFRWILGGRAVQDVFTFNIKDPQPGTPPQKSGTTVRYYDSKIDAWHCIYIDPAQDGPPPWFTARGSREGVLMEVKSSEGIQHWIYSDLTPNSFEWRAEMSDDNGKTWEVMQRIHAHRVNQ